LIRLWMVFVTHRRRELRADLMRWGEAWLSGRGAAVSCSGVRITLSRPSRHIAISK
jgi:hypothetical protein